jgi:hypothetical protein
MKIVVMAVVMAASMLAQGIPRPQPKVIELRHANAHRIRDSGVLNPFVHPGSVNLDPGGKFLIVHAATAEGLAGAEAMIKRLDVPAANVELMFHIVSGTAESSPDKLPSELEPVVKQLRSSFIYKEYRLLDTAMLHAREDREAFVQGALPGNGVYRINFRNMRVERGTPDVFRLENLRFEARMPVRTNEKGDVQYFETNLQTEVDVKEGQKVVVGKSTLPNSAVFLIVSARAAR